ncbi:hypothetical protein BKA93DRAFT_805692 [Sparassis latifolia]
MTDEEYGNLQRPILVARRRSAMGLRRGMRRMIILIARLANVGPLILNRTVSTLVRRSPIDLWRETQDPLRICIRHPLGCNLAATNMPKWHAVYKYILRDSTPNPRPPPEAIVTLHIPLRDFSDIDSLYWAAALDIPTSCLPNFSSYPLRWLCYLSFCLTGSRGDLKRSSQADSPHVNYDDQTALGESASFYFHPERSAFLIDPDMCARELPCETDTENSDGDELWDHLMEREHAECVATGASHDLCSAEHLIPASKGNKEIRRRRRCHR